MKLFVCNLPIEIGNTQLLKMFEKYGLAYAPNVIRDKRNGGRSKGYAYIRMPNREDALKAIESLNGTLKKGNNIIVKESDEKGEEKTFLEKNSKHKNSSKQHGKIVFVCNLPDSIGKIEIQNLFANYGEVLSTKIIYNKETIDSKNYGFVEMAKEEEALKAIESLNKLKISDYIITVKETNGVYEEKREKRRAKMKKKTRTSSRKRNRTTRVRGISSIYSSTTCLTSTKPVQNRMTRQ